MDETTAPSAPLPGPGLADDGVGGAILSGLHQILDLGGPIVALLLVLSVIALTIALVKAWQFVRLRPARIHLIAAVERWRRGETRLAAEQAALWSGPLAAVVNRAMTGLLSGASEDHVREDVEQAADEAVGELRAYLRGLEAIAQAAPLLGLLGTVIGMIDAFRVLESSGGDVDPAGLAGGIWVALLTTAVGLAVAIPTALLLHWFDGRVDGERRTIERLATLVLTNPPLADEAADPATAAPATVAMHPTAGRGHAH